MKITVSKSEFYNRLKALSRIIHTKNTLAAYDNFLFELKNGELKVTTGEEGGSMSTTISFVSDNLIDLSFMANAKTLLDGLKDIPEQPIILEINKKYNIKCIYACGDGKFEIQGEKGETFPTISFNTDSSINVNATDFLYGVKQVLPCIADDELRPVMNGIYFDQKEESITYVATNGMILGCYRSTGKFTSQNSFIIPGKYTRILSNCIQGNGYIDIATDNNNIRFIFDGYSLICRMIEGRFPNYNSVIPQSNNIKVIVSKIDILSAIKRVSVFSNNSSMIVLSINESEKNISVKTQNIDYSLSADELVKIESLQGEKIEIGLNAIFLKEIIALTTSETIEISLKDSSHAITITPESDQTLLYIQMPLLINS